MVQKYFIVKFPKSPKIVEFPKCELFNRKIKKFWRKTNGTKILGKYSRNLGVVQKVILFSRIMENNAVPFTTGKFLEIQTGIFF